MLRQFNNLSIRTKIIVSALAILLLVSVMAGVVYTGIVESQARDQQVVRADDIVHSADALLVQLTTMELNYRSYLLTGDEAFLGPYDQSYQAYAQIQAHLKELIGGDAELADRLHQLDVGVQGWRNFTHQPSIRRRKSLRDKANTSTALFIAAAYRDKKDFEDISARLGAIRAIQLQNGDARRLEAQAAAGELRAMLLAGTLLTAMLSLGTLSLLAHNIARRVQRVTWAASQIANGDTSVRCELPESQDEVGLMGATFNTMAQIIQQRTDDLMSQYTTAEAARCEAEAVRAQLADQLALINEQRAIIRDMSVPVLPLLSSTLVMPLVGPLDSERLELMQAQALRAIERARARRLILDITGVPIIDTAVALGLTQVVLAARLLGARVSIVGIRPEVAQALVGLGVDLRDIATFSDLQSALAREK